MKSELKPFVRKVVGRHLFEPGAAPFATDVDEPEEETDGSRASA
jgi:hypothetical protein